MRAAKRLIFDGLRTAQQRLPRGRAGVLVDEQYGQAVIDEVRAGPDGITLAVPIEASGHDWFTPQWGREWLDHIERIRPDYAKVLVRDNPAFDHGRREEQFRLLADVSGRLRDAGVPLMYELLVPGTEAQLDEAGGDAYRFDRELRPDLVARVISDNQAHGVEPAVWKVEGLETVEAAERIAAAARSGGRTTDLIVLGRDAPAERLHHWLQVAGQVPAFIGFAIGRSIWEDVIRDGGTAEDIAARYLDFVGHWPG
jgi:myo-inositol catabolism protein IolC